MAATVIRKNGIPLYVQVKERIATDIRAGVYRAGDQLPPERDFAMRLGVSRNTISQAYKELEDDGVLISLQGRGTFVRDRDESIRVKSRRDLLKRVVDIALDECLSLGFTTDDFVALAASRAREKSSSMHRAQVVFIECNREQLDYFSRRLESGGVHITPVLLEDLRQPGCRKRFDIQSADLVVTTFFHYDEVRALLDDGRELIGIALDPELETIVAIARIPRTKRVGLVCRSEHFASKVHYTLKEAGLTELNLLATQVDNPYDLADFVSQMDVLIVSPARKREVETYCKRRQQVIEFVFRPDATSVNALRAALADIVPGNHLADEPMKE